MRVIFILLTQFTFCSAFAASESQTFLSKCFHKDYISHKTIKRVTLAIYENLPGDIFGALEIQFAKNKGLTAGVFTSGCQVVEKKITCTDKDGGKISFTDEGEKGVLKVEEALKLKTENQLSPGKVTVTRLPVNSGLNLSKATPAGCEKLVP